MIETSNLYREIHEQSAVVARFLQEEWDPVCRLVDGFRRSELHHVVIAARGASDNAARYARSAI